MGQLLTLTDATVELLTKASKAELRAFLEVLSEAATNAAIANAVAALVNSSPATLDQLNELAAAIGNDPNFATTLATALAGKQPLAANLTTLAQAAAITAFCANLLSQTNAESFRSAIGAGTSNVGTWSELGGKPTTRDGFGLTDVLTIAQIAAAYQPLNSGLTAIAALTTQPFGRGLLALLDQAALQSAHGVDTASADNQAYSGTITWTGTTAPSGASSLIFDWYRVGKQVVFRFRFEWAVAGSAITRVEFPFPAGMPVPVALTGQGNSEIVLMCNGGLGLGGSSMNVNQVEARIQLDSSGSPFIWVRAPSSAVTIVFANGEFRCP